jgi:flagellar hook-associated protein 2
MSSSTSTGTISSSGLVSGIDTNSLTDQLVAIEQQKVTAIQTKQSSAQLALTNLGTVKSMLSTLSSKATALSTMDDFDLFKASSSNSDLATITGTGSGVQGDISVGVQQLATTWKVASSAQTSTVTGLNLAGTLHISKSAAAIDADSSTSTVDVTITAGNTLQDVADKINSASGTGITATIVNFGTGDARLMLNAVDQGSTSFSITEDTGGNVVSGLGLKSSATKEASSFQLKQAKGGAAVGTTKLGDLYTGIGDNNVAAKDTISMTWTNGTASGTTTFSPTDLSKATVSDLTSWMQSTLGGDAQVSVNSSGELVATSATGKTLSFSLSMGTKSDGTGTASTGTIPLGASKDSTAWANVMQQGQQAFYTMNGLAVSSSSNKDSTTLTGATINLVGVTSSTNPEATLSLERDGSGIQQKVQDMLDSYNALQDYIKEQTTSTVKSKKDSNGTTQNTVTPGSLSSDYAVKSLSNQLRTLMTSQIATLASKSNYSSFASVGITTDSETGHLTIDEDKFQTALSADTTGVSRLFANSGWTDNGAATVGGWTKDTQSGTYSINSSTNMVDGSSGNRVGDILFSTTGNSNGLGVTVSSSLAGSFNATFSRGVGGLITQFANSLTSYDGILSTDTTTITKRITDYGTQASDAQDRVDNYRSTLTAQFTAMEQAMQKLKSQSSSFLSQISS